MRHTGPGWVGLVWAEPVHHGYRLYIEKESLFCSMNQIAKIDISRVLILFWLPI